MTTTSATTVNAPAPAGPPPIHELVKEIANAHIRKLQGGYLNDRPEAVAALARIRRGVGKPLHAVPDLWGLEGTDRLYTDIPDRRENERLRAENAVHIAVTLWAVHQQSRRDSPMHVAGGPQLGRAVRALMPGDDIDEPLRRRFVRIGTATSLDTLAQRLRDVVLVLRQHTQAMDYAALAEQIYHWQMPDRRARVRRDWGRNFHARAQQGTPDTQGTEQTKEAS
ncbi:CRISPR-associated protein, Cse2 family [Catenulispora acidiphila DSM 44928]|uniref:CRISPR-associated protein, Cse2 family n=1 Tax=Catenulispora acidiphila (strain DSM 44928 / JCM 14897 / NBRC 102108 / NRRL B-24433 / ID139908) TaxID=479433 RepID=C7QEM6_CATAD|nr:type I-E CRISPR-associated protein Cse2/CasB [Catenulispora acidiphila]ACU72796.1 CRISPR-associated protein, Cse2 family [Catenulispora acidiphila DSM 44928]